MVDGSRAPSGFQLTDAMSVLMQAVGKLRDDPDLEADADLLADFLASDPETCDEMEVLHRLARAAISVEDMGKMARARGAEIIARARRYDAREAALRDWLKQAMEALSLKRISAPDFTASISRGRAGVVVTDETKLEERFVKVERTPMKKEIGEALDAGEVVEGAVRGNPMPQLRLLRS